MFPVFLCYHICARGCGRALSAVQLRAMHAFAVRLLPVFRQDAIDFAVSRLFAAFLALTFDPNLDVTAGFWQLHPVCH